MAEKVSQLIKVIGSSYSDVPICMNIKQMHR